MKHRSRVMTFPALRSRTSLAAAGVLAFLLAFAGCAEREGPTGPSDGAASLLGESGSLTGLLSGDPADEHTPSHEAVAAVVRGFGVYYLDQGMPTVRLTDPSERPAAEAALAGFLESRGFTAEDLRVVGADYDYETLSAWHEAAWPSALSVDGAVQSHVDEGTNRIRFGAIGFAAASAMELAVAGAGVPAEAYVVEIVPPVVPQHWELTGGPAAVEAFASSAAAFSEHTLRDEVRPVPGGYQLNFLNAGGLVTVSLLCTMGFNAIPEDPRFEPIPSFITNAHCSNGEGSGALLATDYYQPLQDPEGTGFADPAFFIGTEADDPFLSVSLDCPTAIPCRWSDAARGEYDEGIPFELGRIARTQGHDRFEATLEVDPRRSFEIVDEQPFAVLGETMNRVGRTSGWTRGEVIATCVNTLALGGVFLRRCQAQVAAGSAGGDSGSPVFRFANPQGNVAGSRVILAGIHWGGSGEGEEQRVVYSPMFNIERDLGKLRTH